MDISVVVVARNEEKNIISCLDALIAQDYAAGAFEILVVDGESTDRTAAIAQERYSRSGKVRLVKNKKKRIAAARNIGIKESRYPFIAFTDADCVVPADWLSALQAAYIRSVEFDVATVAVGGANIPPSGGSVFQQALGMYLDSGLGTLNSPQGRNFAHVRAVTSLSCTNVLYRKEALVEAGGFDERLGNIGEDLDMNMRLKKRGYTLYFIPRLAVTHALRPDLHSWLRNMAVYGAGRAVVTFKHRAFLNPFFLLPFMFAAGILVVAAGLVRPVFMLPAFYCVVMFVYTGIVAVKKKKAALCLHLLTIFIGTQCVYSMALLIKTAAILVSWRSWKNHWCGYEGSAG